MAEKQRPTVHSKPLTVTVRGRVIARVAAQPDRRAAARAWLRALRKKARVGELLSPSGECWNAERGRS